MNKYLFLIILLASSVFSQKQIAFDADEFHLSAGGALVYHMPYSTLQDKHVGGGFTVALDKSFREHAALSFGGELQTVWYAQEAGSASYSLTPSVRMGFHPLGLKVLRGEVPAAYYIDPYIMFKVGVHFDNRLNNTIYPAISPITLGIRWYFSDNIALVFEADAWYDVMVGIGFWF